MSREAGVNVKRLRCWGANRSGLVVRVPASPSGVGRIEPPRIDGCESVFSILLDL